METYSFSRSLRLVAALVLLASGALGAHAGGEIYGTIHTDDGRQLKGSIRWDRNEVFWGDRLDGTRREPIKKDETKRKFNFSIFGIRLGGGENEFTHHGLSIPFGHLQTLEPTGPREARLTLKDGNQIEIRSGSTDIGTGMRELIVYVANDDGDPTPVELDWEQIDRIEFAAGPGVGRDAERLFGTVKTQHGTLRGTIVFDTNESLAGDLLSGSVKGRDQDFALGDISKLIVDGDNAQLTLKQGGTAVDLKDIKNGRAFRSITVTVAGVGAVEADWDDVLEIEFLKPGESPRYGAFDGGRRLTGTAHARSGDTWSGKIQWDRDEIYTFDTLDGELRDLDYAIPFANIVEVRRKSDDASEIVVAGGEVVTLEGTNDVDDSNRGILVEQADGTVVELDWEDLDRVEFQNTRKPPSGPTDTTAASKQ